MFVDCQVPPRVLATYVSRADETGASLDELVQQIMELLERYAISRGRNRGNVPHIGTSASTGATNRQGVPLSPLLRTSPGGLQNSCEYVQRSFALSDVFARDPFVNRYSQRPIIGSHARPCEKPQQRRLFG